MKNKIKKIIKNDLARYLTNEEGKVVKRNVVKMALALGILTTVLVEEADADHASHNNVLHNSAANGTYHASGHLSHNSHGSHGSHSSW